MNLTQIETNIEHLVASFSKDTFIYELLLAYGIQKASISRLQKGGLNLSKVEGEIAWKKKLFFKAVEHDELQVLMDAIKVNGIAKKVDPRFIVLTNYNTFMAYDRKTGDSLDIPMNELVKHGDFFMPWAGIEKSQQITENIADVRAAERMAKLYDEIVKDNPAHSKVEVHSLNVFLSRLLFCFFAEDTDIFDKSLFTNSISNHTQADGSDLQAYLDRLFDVLNTAPDQRIGLPAYLEKFPYVNGGLFRNKSTIPVFRRRSRQLIIESGGLGWAEINPDIFGSMIQAVITPEHRGGLGMHYTSVPNIMKVIEPLFLDDLKEEFEAAKGNVKKLTALLQRLWKIKLFDPACGSGNFLIIAYKELRRLEMKIFKEIDLANKFHSNQFSGISLGNFYGIELDDFAHEIAILSLWLAEHQMNREFFASFGRTKPALPLKETGNIVHGNACRLDWEQVCPKKEGDEIYIMGNPPYLGSSLQSKDQKDDMIYVFNDLEGYKNLDYIACWFLKGSKFIHNQCARFAFVSTNSICQGEQVQMIWPLLFNMGAQIGFCTSSFIWDNNAKNRAAVFCVIVGVRNYSNDNRIYYKSGLRIPVKNIGPYLIPSNTNVIISKRVKSLSRLPEMSYGNKPTDGGHLLLTEEEKNKMPISALKFIKKIVGAKEFMERINRYCLWIEDSQVEEALLIPEIAKRVEFVKEMRISSTKIPTKKLAEQSHKFGEIRHQNREAILIPRHGSGRRDYFPFGYITSDIIISDAAQVIYTNEMWIFGVISSKIHFLWINISCGKIKEDPRYSSSLGYNTFPFPSISDTQKQELEHHVYRILEEREKHCEKTLAQLYDPDKMPEGLREAHRQNDLAVERCYRSRPFESDEERLEYLFKLYEQMIEEEKGRGTLFEKSRTKKRS